MKTSNKWLLGALLLLLSSLTAYNIGLRTEYKEGAYRNPQLNTTALNFKDFHDVDVLAAGLMGVQVMAGPYDVRIRKGAEKYVKVTQQGSRLKVAVVFPESRELFNSRTDVLTIHCPQLRHLTVSATYLVDGKVQINRVPAYPRPVLVTGFRQDSLLIRQDLGSQVALAHTQLGYLQAEAGHAPGSQSVLHIENTNRILAADLSVQHQAELKLAVGGIRRLRTQFSDSARATLAGAGLSNLGQHQE